MGDTPAVCLTQDIPSSYQGEEKEGEEKEGEEKEGEKREGEEKEKNQEDNDSGYDQEDPISILLLGCGDLRKILFTINHDARNILLLTLLIDMDSQPPLPPSLHDLFPIYYHLYLPPRLANLIVSQARKLVDVSDSLQAWHKSTYGRGGIRFCDSYSLSRVREIWQCWAQFDGNEPTITDLKAKFEADLAATRDVKTDERVDSTGRGLVYTAVRSAAPAVDDDMHHLNDLHQWFWRVGLISMSLTKESTQVNPMFVTPDGHVRMHWGLDPLLGFPLAEAYTRMVDEPEGWGADDVSSRQKVVALVMGKFAAWCQSFKDAWAEGSVVTRWFVGDAVAFGHTLQGLASGSIRTPHWYRSRHSFRPLKLDGEDYQPDSSTPAPLSFMVIDTSNLIDDLGALNVLVATSPVLENNLAATLYTEILTRYHRTYKEEADNLLCGPLSTVALLLGLFCVEHSTNTSPYPSQDAMTYQMMKNGSAKPRDVPPKLYQPYERLRWKRPIAH
ncbi:hypothetical protein B0H65DRAFT_429118 [Neurospora tetraspora]|uniref:DUF4470 domain-containing protein n=1 Tax=Neurospora tetraspora TaxID=94610 RepID=A0AAE0JCC9_9PEZI|nr:hypothetical protein B0H65DRAFT_429118 [Neurospora tetraspora]